METVVDECCDFIFKVVLIGERGVGKSSILQRFKHGTFTTQLQSTIGADFTVKTMPIDGKIVKLQIWDTAGQEQFRAIAQLSYRHAKAIILCYDLSNRKSFESIPRWMREIRLYAPDDVIIVLIATKADLDDQRVVNVSEGAEEAVAHGMQSFLETSSKNDSNVTETFVVLATQLKGECEKNFGDGQSTTSIRLSATTAVEPTASWGYCGSCGSS